MLEFIRNPTTAPRSLAAVLTICYLACLLKNYICKYSIIIFIYFLLTHSLFQAMYEVVKGQRARGVVRVRWMLMVIDEEDGS
jgi:hypothetical protein